MKQATTLKEIAKTLNLSVSTVSRALQNNQAISAKTRKKVIELAKVLEYEPNNIAVQLRTNTSKIFALIVPSISNYFYNSFISAVEHECSLNQFSIIVLQSGDDESTLAKNLHTCQQNRVSGIFACTAFSGDLNEFLKFQSQNVPVIFFDKTPDTNSFHKICLEDEKAAALAAIKIIEKKKKNVIALFGNEDLSITTKRLYSFKKTFESFADENIELTIKTGIDFIDAKQLTQINLLKNPPPDCIFCMSDEILTGVMRAIQESGKKYPNEVGVIAISHGFFPSLYYPEITYVETSGSKLGKVAFKQMLAAINENKMPQEVYVESLFIEGGSL